LPLLAAGALVAAAAVLPAAYLVIVCADDVGATVETMLRSRTLEMALRSAGLATAVTATAVAVAVPLAFLTTRTTLPGARAWATLLSLPIVIPSYVGAYTYVAALGPSGMLQGLLEPLGIERLPGIYGFGGAWLVLSLFTYPLVLITVRSAIVRLDPRLEEVALVAGRSRPEIFRTVTLPQLKPAIGAGGLLVALYVLSDFGAVSLLRFQSFTREIYISFQSSFDRGETAALGLVLVALTLALLALYTKTRRQGSYYRSSPGAARPPRPIPLGRWRWPAIGACSLLAALALAVPLGVLLYWAGKGIGDAVDWGSVGTAAWHSLLAGGLAAAAAAAAAITISLLVVRYPSPVSRLLERAGYAGYALPGIVVALALVFFGTRIALPLYQTLAMLVIALAIHFLPLAVAAISASLLQVPPRLEEASRTLGRGSMATFATVTGPLAAPGVAAGAALVLLYAVKELPATLLLAPAEFQTLATQVWTETTFGLYGGAAIPALVLVLVAAPPLYLLSGEGVHE